MNITIRELIPEDASKLLRLQYQLDEESAYMLLEPGERQGGIQQIRDMIESFALAEQSILIGAEEGDQLIGFISLRGGSVQRNRHNAYIVIGILKEYQGCGIGTGLLKESDIWALANGISRLELTVMTHNQRAIALYKKCGFSIEGTRINSLKVGGQWINEYYMGKIINEKK